MKCLLVDDEPPAIEVLRRYIETTPSLEVTGECHHGMEAFEFIRQNKVDLIFLDIQMPKLLGTDLMKALPHPPKVIFTTAYREYAADGFDLNAVDYLLKPFSLDRFLKAVHKAQQGDLIVDLKTETIPENDRFLYFRADRKMVKVIVNDIQYIESLKDYVKIITGSQTITTKQTITAVEAMLPADHFLRIHRSFIVAVNKINSYTPQSVFIQKEEIPVGPLYRNEVAKRLTGKK
ncbi:MAG TPA: LytTR family DNA-binding domain-containing protein [Cyclobacteriaceae bacterium]